MESLLLKIPCFNPFIVPFSAVAGRQCANIHHKRTAHQPISKLSHQHIIPLSHQHISTLLQFPHQGTGPQYRRIGFFQLTENKFHLVLKNGQQVFFHVLTGWFQYQVAGLGHATK
jgi:hypothetical protein